MTNKRTRAIASVMLLSMSLSMFAACSSSDTTTTTTSTTTSSSSTSTTTTTTTDTGNDPIIPSTGQGTLITLEELEALPDDLELTDLEAEPITLPIVTDGTSISFLNMPNSYVTSKMSGFADMTIHQEAEARTGVHIEWQEENYNDPSEKINLMFSTGDTTDIVWQADAYVTGGADKLLEEGLILPLNKYIEYYAPNLKALFLENPDLLLECTNDNGIILAFPEIRLAQANRSNAGFMIRADWLEQAGLEVPTTIDEWYTAIKTFQDMDMNGNGERDEYFVSTELKQSVSFLGFLASYRITNGFGLEGDTVIYGPANERYYDFLVEMKKWYDDGILDPEYATTDSTALTSKMLNDTGAGTCGTLAGNIGSFLSARYGVEGDTFDIVGCPYPLADDGVSYTGSAAFLSQVPYTAVLCSSVEENVIVAVKWLDWHYSEEGIELYNWGIEGEAFEYDENGDRHFTELITNNPDGLSLNEAGVKYAGNTLTNNPTVDAEDVFYELRDTPQQQAAIDVWSQVNTDLILPDVSFTDEQTIINSNYLSEITTYYEEMIHKFIMGVTPLNEETFQDYVDTLYSMGLQEVTDAYQESYDKKYVN